MTPIGPQVDLPYCLSQSQETTLRRATKLQRCNPLELPEVLTIIFGEYLPRNVVVACLCVCRMWHQVLLPWVWSSIELKEKESLPNPSALETHSFLVRKLHIRDDCDTLWDSIHLPRLTTLFLATTVCQKEEVTELIRRHQSTLLSLHVSCSVTPERLEAVLGCQRLEKLQLFEAELDDSQWISIYEKLLRRLKALTLTAPLPIIQKAGDDTDLVRGVKGMDPFSVWESASIGRLQDLVLRGENLHAHFGIIRKCPDLVRLEWYSQRCTLAHAPMRLLAQELQYGAGWDRLESLILRQSFSNVHFAILIDRLPGLTALDMSGSNFDSQSWHLLKASILAKRLRSLALMRCRSLLGSSVHDILCTLKALHTFRADFISEADLEQDIRPWTCYGLKEMRVCFSPVSKSYEDVIALRLSHMTKLQVLDLDYSRLSLYLSIDGRENEFGVLDRLRTLRDMTNFRVRLSSVAWNNTEFEWVLEHWPNLRKLCVPLSGDDLGVLAAQTESYY